MLLLWVCYGICLPGNASAQLQSCKRNILASHKHRHIYNNARSLTRLNTLFRHSHILQLAKRFIHIFCMHFFAWFFCTVALYVSAELIPISNVWWKMWGESNSWMRLKYMHQFNNVNCALWTANASFLFQPIDSLIVDIVRVYSLFNPKRIYGCSKHALIATLKVYKLRTFR